MKHGIEHHHFRFFLVLNLCLAGFLLSFVINQVFNGYLARASASSGAFSTSNIPIQLAYLTGPYFLSPNTCSPVVTIQAQDALGNPLAAPSDATVLLSSNNQPLYFYSDSGCNISIKSVVILSGSSEANFYVEKPFVGWTNMGVSSAGINTAWQSEDFEYPPTGNLPQAPSLPGLSATQTSSNSGDPINPPSVTITESSTVSTGSTTPPPFIFMNAQVGPTPGFPATAENEEAYLSYNTQNATVCVLSGSIFPNYTPPLEQPTSTLGGSNNTSTGSGGIFFYYPNVVSATYTLTCWGPGGKAVANLAIGSAIPSAPVTNISATSTSEAAPTIGISGALGSSGAEYTLTLTWSSANATACTASGAWSGSRALSGTSVQNLDPSTLEKFTITCSGPGGSTNSSVTVQPPHPPIKCELSSCRSGTQPPPLDFNNFFSIPTAYAQSINNLADMTPCSYIQGFASSCIAPSDSTTNLISFSGETATTTQVSFALTAALPPTSSATSSVLWNTGYYWSQASSKWIPFTLSGAIYKGVTCSSLISGCWLSSAGSARISVSPNAAGSNGSLFLLTYDAQWENGSWRGSSCAHGSGSCWRISVYPPTTIGALILDAEGPMSIQNLVSVVESAGYLVQTASSDGIPSVVIKQPFTHEVILSASGPED